MLKNNIFWLLALAFCTVSAQRSCVTPYNTYGRCVPYQQCDFIKKLLTQNAIQQTAEFVNELRKWICQGGRDERNFCCDESLSTQVTLFGSNLPNDDYVASLNAQGLARLRAQKCGNADDVRVAYGENADLYEFPFMALLRYNSVDQPFKCGGTLITDDYILTAAHCVVSLNEPLIGVRLGEYDVSTEKDCVKLGRHEVCAPPVEDYGIAKVLPHPDYSSAHKTSDVALIKLDRKVEFKRHIKPICLPIYEEAARIEGNQDFNVAGWGYTEKGHTANILQKAVIKYKSRSSCQQIFRRTRINNNHICAGGTSPVDSCKGDSGGPLFALADYNRIQRYVQLGIVSFGNVECGANRAVPGIYANIAHFMPWITSNII